MDIWSLNLRHLRALAATVRLGSVSRAARAISISQPAVTQAMSRLEAILEQPMFLRSPGGMEPTEAARLMQPRIDAALAHIGSTRITMTQMRALIAVAQGGGYAGASVLTGLSQPSLHRAVADLSLVIGRPLVERRGRGTVFSDAGNRILRNMRLARAELEAALSEVATAAGQECGQVSIGAMPLSRARILPNAVSSFHAIHPEIDIRIIEGSRAELVEPLRDGELDMMVGALRLPLIDPDLTQYPMFDDQPIIIGRKDHPLAGRGFDIQALSQCDWIIAAPGTPLRLLWERMFTESAIPIPRVPVECGSVIAIRQMLIASDFLTLLSPEQVAVELEAGWLAPICAAPDWLVRTIGVTTRADWRPTGKQAAFLETILAAHGASLVTAQVNVHGQ
jgi:LysR family transcriptional regulator, regulator for genes of the gallate degradation pathway